MAVTQTITFTKSDTTFQNDIESQNELEGIVNDSDYTSYLTDLKTAGTLTETTAFDVDTQTHTLVRTWNTKEAFDLWESSKSTEIANHGASLDAAGFTYTINTVE
jgi:hypothetical protein|tara:strand:+ start:165 stop:479 length:315 start_codon:yes stop_codon:yes gene_type:complete